MNGTVLEKDMPVELALTGTARDPILFWNKVALEANRISHTNGANEQNGPPLSARALAIVHLAMYDAYARVVVGANLPIYMDGVVLAAPATTAATEEDIAVAAVSAAAHTTLSVLFPSQIAAFNQELQQMGDPASPGHAFGHQVAVALLQDRIDDPGAGDCGYVASKDRGAHRLDPDNPGQGYHAPCYGSEARAFAITDSRRHELDKPPFDNAEYRTALNEVRARGIAPELMATLPASAARRTPAETIRGIFWGYDGAPKLGTPPRLYNQIVRAVAVARDNSVAANARLFALVNVAMADAGILAWEQKYIHKFWRPVVGVREHDGSMGPAASDGSPTLDAACDPFWRPLGAPSTNRTGVKNFTPNFPAYPSGHATFGAAALHITRLFYGDSGNSRDNLFKDLMGNNLQLESDEFNGVNTDNQGAVRPRHLHEFPDGLWQMIIENGLSRVDLGVHWVFDAFAVKTVSGAQVPDLSQNIGGVPLGLAIAEDIFKSGMKRSNVEPLGTQAVADFAAGDGESADGAAAQPAAPRRGGSWQDRVAYPPAG